ncbi:hypothetical protein LEP1GSC077_2920 [Leptospira interrogans str. C10069]|nr:hypothetical protein LEP1GSC007_1650 [Leptospira interrogans serovar Bulgarica str. Mallika]EKO08624.1 hypothetical protein LEP1GSC077_2920 [Leptospira interrogans str. C10069]EMN63298.1 hypothetical protein LEP1GSC092_0174 [Leptospira interrogans serovar Pyrogenes str. R168]
MGDLKIRTLSSKDDKSCDFGPFIKENLNFRTSRKSKTTKGKK